jgi:catechol 2,3-dioxygenase-like lactoylglutathione lyase family enzyme
MFEGVHRNAGANGSVQVSLVKQRATRSDLAALVEGKCDKEQLMRIHLSSMMVDDQEKALRFYTGVLGFVIKHDIPLGEYRWLTVVSPEDPDGTELVLEPDEHPAAKPFKAALVEDGIPFTSFAVRDVAAEHNRLEALGVRFTQQPTDLGTVITAVFDDTCGNLIQIAQEIHQS